MKCYAIKLESGQWLVDDSGIIVWFPSRTLAEAQSLEWLKYHPNECNWVIELTV